MLCQKCGKNIADVHFVQTINGEKTEALLCGICAAESGFGISPISFTSFLQGFMDTTAAIQPEAGTKTELKCGNCGMSLREMKVAGKAGCTECYNVFKAQMETIIKSAQAGSVHTGKIPKRAEHVSVGREIGELKRKLARAIELEEYEEAASIRDALKALKGCEADGRA